MSTQKKLHKNQSQEQLKDKQESPKATARKNIGKSPYTVKKGAERLS